MRIHSCCARETNLSVDALGGHALLGDAVARALDPWSLHPAAAQGKLLQPLRVSCIAAVWKADNPSQTFLIQCLRRLSERMLSVHLCNL